MAFGWLRKMGGGPLFGKWLGGYGGGVPAYSYGWPSGGSLESDVIEQWTFDVSSGNITGAVSAVVLAGNGTRTYSVSNDGYYSNASYTGVTLGTPPSGYFIKDASGLTFGAGDGTIEVVLKTPATSGLPFMACYSPATGGAYGIYFYGGPNRIRIILYDASANTANLYFAMPSTYSVGTMQKLRIVIDRTGSTVKCVLDGEETSTESIAGLVDTIGLGRIVVGADYPVSTYTQTTFYELRFSGNATNNSGGPGGG